MPDLNIKTHPKQKGFIEDKSRYCAAVAGIRGGKTQGGAIKGLIKSVENPGARGCVTAPTYKILGDATIPKYKEVFPGDYAKFVGGDAPMSRFTDGGEIIFRSTEKPDHLRGMEISWFHMDEAALTPSQSYEAFQILKGRLSQKLNGKFPDFQGWVTTTPKGLNWIYTEFAAQTRDDYKLFQWKTSDNIFLPDTYISSLDYSGKQRDQELDGKFLLLEGECYFDVVGLNQRLIRDCRDPIVLDNGLAQMWKEPYVGVRYVAGVDCADEGGGGANCMIVMNADTGEECLEVYGDIASDWFSQRINDWGRKYNAAFMAIEKNGTVGGYVVAKLEELHYPSLYKDTHGKTGWFTGSNRPVLLEEYRSAVNRNQTIIYSREAIQELLCFVASPAGRYEHMEGQKDDRVMARAICWYMRKQRHDLGNRIISVKRLATTYA